MPLDGEKPLWVEMNWLGEGTARIPHRSGIYRFIAREPFVLSLTPDAAGHRESRAPASAYAFDRATMAVHVGQGHIAYVGRTELGNALSRRLGQYRRTESASLRQRICALLSQESAHERHLVPHPTPAPDGKCPFRLTDESQRYLSQQMRRMFRVEYLVTAECVDEEVRAIAEHRPLLNFRQPRGMTKEQRQARNAIQAVFTDYRRTRFWEPSRALWQARHAGVRL
ncbi:MAG: hypothetical protein JNM30_05810 [Rhodospirillales bacterium]|nr:hypothetical protein [Rhodospirillales bacterium]